MLIITTTRTLLVFKIYILYMGKYRKIYIPNTLIGEEEKRRHKPRNWKHVYFFNNKNKNGFETPVIELWKPNEIKSFNSQTLYKCRELSLGNDIFDYYKIMKVGLPVRTAQIKNKEKKTDIEKKKMGLTITYFPPNKPYILKF
jgi:hypothetical protein